VSAEATEHPAFPEAARAALANSQMRRNVGHAARTIRAKRERVVAELEDWEELREAGRALKERVLRHLDDYLLELEAAVQHAGGVVHWARDGEECNRIVADLVAANGAREVIKSKSLTTEETALNEALAAREIKAWETDLAQLIVQLSGDTPSHILVPAIHRNRGEIRELFLRTLPGAPPELSDDPHELAEAARRHLRELFLTTPVGISGANFAVAETCSVVVVESEGNARMCTTLPVSATAKLAPLMPMSAWANFSRSRLRPSLAIAVRSSPTLPPSSSRVIVSPGAPLSARSTSAAGTSGSTRS